jgi:hypothetical protein
MKYAHLLQDIHFLKNSAKRSIDPGAVISHGRPRRSKGTEKCG